MNELIEGMNNVNIYDAPTEISLDGITQTGFGCIASIDAYDKNIIKKHEYTTPIKEDDRVLNITKLKAQTGPVLLTYKKNDQLHHILKESKEDQPIYNVKAHDYIKYVFSE